MATNANDCTVNELLSFLVNRMNTMPADLLTKLVSDFYDDKEVVVENECLLGHLPPTNTSQRNVRRKGANKKTMNIQDILHIILNFEVEDIPCFVARDLSNLPPLTQDHFDLASVMRNHLTCNINYLLWLP